MNRILHLFEWRLNDITKELSDIKNQGFNCIQISPIQPLKEYTSSFFNREEHNRLTLELIDSGYIDKEDLQLYYYDDFFEELINKGKKIAKVIGRDIVTCQK